MSFRLRQFSHSVVSDSLWPHGLQHIRLPCPSPTPRACSKSCPSCHITISSSVISFFSWLQFFPASGSFPVSQRFASGGQSIGSFSFSIGPFIEYSGLISFSIDWFDLFTVRGTLKSLLQHCSSTPLGSFHPILWLWLYIDNSLNCITYLTARTIPIIYQIVDIRKTHRNHRFNHVHNWILCFSLS